MRRQGEFLMIATMNTFVRFLLVLAIALIIALLTALALPYLPGSKGVGGNAI
jgi:hypothetical protein